MKILHIGKKGNVQRFSHSHYLEQTFDLVECNSGLSDEAYLQDGWDAEFIIVDAMTKVGGSLIEKMPKLKMIHSEGVGYNFIDLETAKNKKVFVCNCKGVNASAVAEQTLLLMLGVLRNVVLGDQAVRNAQQIQMKENYMKESNLRELSDLKVGLVGFGDIAQATAKLLHAFNVDVYYYSHHQVSEEVEELFHVTYLPIEELLENCEMISLHLPVTDLTRNSINDDFFSKMKDQSYLINTARGELVDTNALIHALKTNKLKMAGLDTIAGEPVQKDNSLINQSKEILDKIVFSPHIAGITASSFKRSYEMTWIDIQLILNHQKPTHIVNPWENEKHD